VIVTGSVRSVRWLIGSVRLGYSEQAIDSVSVQQKLTVQTSIEHNDSVCVQPNAELSISSLAHVCVNILSYVYIIRMGQASLALF
jgi:hypothetical protein